MAPLRRLLPALAFVAALGSIGCGSPPDKELQDAQAAIDAARTGGADQYARDEFAAATDSLKRAHDAVGERDYRMALNLALDARERAQTAAKDAAKSKAAARRDGERAIADAATALTAAKALLRTAEGDRTAKSISHAREVVTGAESDLQKARTTFEAGDYSAAIATANQTAATLKGISRDLQTSAAPPPKRKRPAPRKK
jgi:hypothetical protein